MKISIVIHSKLPVVGYGGIERAAYWLGRELAILGHKITFVCKATGPIHFAKTRAWASDTKASFDQQLERSIDPDSDIVHFCSPPPEEPRRPYLVTVHGNGKAGETFLPNTVFVSRNHAERHNWTEFVYNGIPLEDYPMFTGPKKRQLVFLAKATWGVKNLKGAIKIAKQVNMPLRICGGTRPWYQIPSSEARYMGMVDGKGKLRELSDAKAMIFPVVWHEPFGIAVIEALAVGTPVLATPFGALPEIVTAQCGRICSTHEEFIQAVPDMEKINPLHCRQRVEELFSSKKMALSYLECYKKILSNKKLRNGFPSTPSDMDGEQLMLYPGAPRPLKSFWGS